MINADLSDFNNPLLSWLNAGYYSDFTVRWYKDVGKIITSTMTNIIFWPILEFCGFFTLRYLARFYDRGCCCCCRKNLTKKKTIQDYVDLYAGPVYFIHYKYSYILNVVFITFMFGAGIPILFFQALAALIVLYVCERLTLAYSCIPPPMYD